MPKRKNSPSFDQKAIRDWTLYVIRLKNDHYYIGITSFKDFMRRINQHGSLRGARVNRDKEVEEIIEIHPLGRVTGKRAGCIENDFMLQYRKKFGARKVRGGFDISKSTPLIPTYTPGSSQSMVFIAVCLLIGLALLTVIYVL
jgi:predicted GIY-YIG superfamily endonuclease